MSNRIVFTPAQKEIFNRRKRFNCVASGRRFGKTFLGKGIIWLAATTDLQGNPATHRNVLYTNRTMAETHQQMYRPFVQWLQDLEKAAQTKLIAHKAMSPTMIVTLVNGSNVIFRSGDTPDAARGWSLDLYYGDEFSFSDPELWPAAQPALADRQGTAFLVSSPSGYNHFHELWLKGMTGTPEEKKYWQSFQYTTLEGGNVPPEEVEIAKVTMSPKQWRQEFCGSFEGLEGRVYSEFDRNDHLFDQLKLDIQKDLLIGMDFNVDNISLVVCQVVHDQLWVIEEHEQIGYTQDAADLIKQRYHQWQGRTIVFPDASGNSRDTKIKGITDHLILRRNGFKLIVGASNPNVRDRVNTTNALFRSANGDIRLFIHPRCQKLIKALLGLIWKNGERDKHSGLDHITDALDYTVWHVFPMIEQRLKIGSL